VSVLLLCNGKCEIGSLRAAAADELYKFANFWPGWLD
jgi:hypothetical protein